MNFEEKMEYMAENVALGNYTVGYDGEHSYEAIVDALEEGNREAIESMGVTIWEPFEDYPLHEVARLIRSDYRILMTFGHHLILYYRTQPFLDLD